MDSEESKLDSEKIEENSKVSLIDSSENNATDFKRLLIDHFAIIYFARFSVFFLPCEQESYTYVYMEFEFSYWYQYAYCNLIH